MTFLRFSDGLMLQPFTEPLHVLDGHMTGNITVFRFHFRYRHLSERYVLGEFNVFVDFYVIHL